MCQRNRLTNCSFSDISLPESSSVALVYDEWSVSERRLTAGHSLVNRAVIDEIVYLSVGSPQATASRRRGKFES